MGSKNTCFNRTVSFFQQGKMAILKARGKDIVEIGTKPDNSFNCGWIRKVVYQINYVESNWM